MLANPAVQAGVAPFLVALVLSLALWPLRLGGLAIIAALVVCTYLVSGIQFTPLTATRKVLIVALAAAALGPLIDFALRPNRASVALIALAAGAGALWAFWPVIAQKEGNQAWLLGGTAAVTLAVVIALSLPRLPGDGVRAGAVGLALGLGAGASAIVAGSLSYGLFGISLGAGAGGFLLPQMLRGKKAAAGATFVLPAMVACGLVAVGALLLAQLPWYCALLLALVPAVAWLPGAKAAVWLQAVLFSLYGFVVAGVACALAWPSSQP